MAFEVDDLRFNTFSFFHCFPFKKKTRIKLYWKNKNNEIKITEGKVGQSLLQVAHHEEIDLEGACGGVCACSTCHVILETKIYNQLPQPTEEEEDMLDLAFGLTSTSRLGCQIILQESYNNMMIQLPSATRNFYVDGHVPKPH